MFSFKHAEDIPPHEFMHKLPELAAVLGEVTPVQPVEVTHIANMLSMPTTDSVNKMDVPSLYLCRLSSTPSGLQNLYCLFQLELRYIRHEEHAPYMKAIEQVCRAITKHAAAVRFAAIAATVAATVANVKKTAVANPSDMDASTLRSVMLEAGAAFNVANVNDDGYILRRVLRILDRTFPLWDDENRRKVASCIASQLTSTAMFSAKRVPSSIRTAVASLVVYDDTDTIPAKTRSTFVELCSATPPVTRQTNENRGRTEAVVKYLTARRKRGLRNRSATRWSDICSKLSDTDWPMPILELGHYAGVAVMLILAFKFVRYMAAMPWDMWQRKLVAMHLFKASPSAIGLLKQGCRYHDPLTDDVSQVRKIVPRAGQRLGAAIGQRTRLRVVHAPYAWDGAALTTLDAREEEVAADCLRASEFGDDSGSPDALKGKGSRPFVLENAALIRSLCGVLVFTVDEPKELTLADAKADADVGYTEWWTYNFKHSSDDLALGRRAGKNSWLPKSYFRISHTAYHASEERTLGVQPSNKQCRTVTSVEDNTFFRSILTREGFDQPLCVYKTLKLDNKANAVCLFAYHVRQRKSRSGQSSSRSGQSSSRSGQESAQSQSKSGQRHLVLLQLCLMSSDCTIPFSSLLSTEHDRWYVTELQTELQPDAALRALVDQISLKSLIARKVEQGAVTHYRQRQAYILQPLTKPMLGDVSVKQFEAYDDSDAYSHGWTGAYSTLAKKEKRAGGFAAPAAAVHAMLGSSIFVVGLAGSATLTATLASRHIRSMLLACVDSVFGWLMHVTLVGETVGSSILIVNERKDLFVPLFIAFYMKKKGYSISKLRDAAASLLARLRAVCGCECELAGARDELLKSGDGEVGAAEEDARLPKAFTKDVHDRRVRVCMCAGMLVAVNVLVQVVEHHQLRSRGGATWTEFKARDDLVVKDSVLWALSYIPSPLVLVTMSYAALYTVKALLKFAKREIFEKDLLKDLEKYEDGPKHTTTKGWWRTRTHHTRKKESVAAWENEEKRRGMRRAVAMPTSAIIIKNVNTDLEHIMREVYVKNESQTAVYEKGSPSVKLIDKTTARSPRRPQRRSADTSPRSSIMLTARAAG
jgi:hypothetical protein